VAPWVEQQRGTLLKDDGMNHYPHHIGDYAKDTMHLSPLEHGVYRLLMDAYYATEQPLPADMDGACRIARAVSRPERQAVEKVLNGFFTRTESHYRHKRIDEELAIYAEKVEKNRLNGRSGGRPRKPNGYPEETQTVSERLAKRNPEGNPEANRNVTLTNNQEPITSKRQKQKTRLPDGFAVSDGVREWAAKHGFSDDLEAHLAYFRDWAISSASLKADWDATFRNAIRGNWAKVPRSTVRGSALPSYT
jgi:uncharacterized protein YdaU (DUF1376 family)